MAISYINIAYGDVSKMRQYLHLRVEQDCLISDCVKEVLQACWSPGFREVEIAFSLCDLRWSIWMPSFHVTISDGRNWKVVSERESLVLNREIPGWALVALCDSS